MFAELLVNIRSEVLLSIVVLFIVYFLGKVIKKNRNLPPGPVGLPIAGYLPFLTNNPHLKFIQLSKKYGDVFGLYLGSKYVVVLNDADSIREAFAKRELLARPPNSPFDLFEIHSPFFTDDFHMWQEQRRFVVHSMKDLGLGKSKIETHIQDEIKHFLAVLEKSNGKPLNLMETLTPSMSNNICALVFGERYEYDDPNRIMMDNALDNVGKTLGQTQSHIFLPWLRKLPFFTRLFDYEKAKEAFRKIRSFTEERIAKHKKTVDPKNIRDFIDSYILEQRNRKENNLQTTFSDENMEACVLNLFGAGSETVRTSITWIMYIMASFPEVQERVQKEIQEKLGSNRFPEFLDQKNMSYTQAVIREVMRWKTVVPLNGLRYTLDDTKISGYDIPKGTIVIANFWSVHHDPMTWKDPERFLPERFLDESGNLEKNSNFMPFSVGKRSCPGETMAMVEVFLYFVSILQMFKVTFPPNFTPAFEAVLGITFKLKPYEICFMRK